MLALIVAEIGGFGVLLDRLRRRAVPLAGRGTLETWTR